MAVLWEAMVDEARAVQLDLAARASLASDGESIADTRHVIDDAIRQYLGAEPEDQETRVARSAAKLAAADASGFVEVG